MYDLPSIYISIPEIDSLLMTEHAILFPIVSITPHREFLVLSFTRIKQTMLSFI